MTVTMTGKVQGIIKISLKPFDIFSGRKRSKSKARPTPQMI
jgi:hypothetical protein